MSYIESLEDGIKMIETIPGHEMYAIPCEMCGRKVVRTQYSRKRTYICDYCKGVVRKKKAVLDERLAKCETKREKQFNSAVEKIKKQVDDFQKYENAINIAKTRAELYGSIPEAMVAIELIKLKYKIIPQQKVGRYKVDFVIPKEKIAIEVDGEIYHRSPYKGEREATIQFSLGLEWKIIHIPAELIAEDITKLNTLIHKMCEQ